MNEKEETMKHLNKVMGEGTLIEVFDKTTNSYVAIIHPSLEFLHNHLDVLDSLIEDKEAQVEH